MLIELPHVRSGIKIGMVTVGLFIFFFLVNGILTLHARHQISDISFPLSADFSAAWSFVMGEQKPNWTNAGASAIHRNSPVIVTRMKP